MPLKPQITEDMKSALKAKDTPRLSALRLLLAAMKQREVDERIELSDIDILTIIEKMIKQRRDSISQFESAGRQDLAEAEKFEVSVISAYLPQALTESEINLAVTDALQTSGAKTIQDMGKVMAILKPKLAGRADMAQVSSMVKTQLSK